MIQYIIVFIIVVASVTYTIKSFFFKNKSQKCSDCEVKCNSCIEHKIVWKNNK